MASNGTYGDPEVALGGASAIYVNQNVSNSPTQQQQQHIHNDADMQLRENIQQLQQASSADMMQHQAAPQAHQMNALSAAHHHFQAPSRPTHSPQHMAQSAQSVMGMEDPNAYGDDAASRKRSKVSRACDECRRKKVIWPSPYLQRDALGLWLTRVRFDAMRPARTVRKPALAARGPPRDVSLADSP